MNIPNAIWDLLSRLRLLLEFYIVSDLYEIAKVNTNETFFLLSFEDCLARI